MKPKVSCIVPIYKVEKYLSRCIESILNQTYVNIEVILIDDGSPDNCGKIADDYVKKDSRIKTLHKDNGGLSDARNYGMQFVTGEFIVFVDSDDWLENVMIERMVNESFKFNADVVQTAFYYAYDSYLFFDNRYYSKDHPAIVLDTKSLMTNLVINERVKNFAWGKLYKVSIIKDIPFKKGVLFEDVFWAHKVMQKVKTYVILNQPMCYYYQRNDSIVATYTSKNLDIIKGLKERHKFIEEFYEDLINESYKMILKTSLLHYNLLLANREEDKDGLHRKKIQQYVKGNYNDLKRAVKEDKKLKKQLYLFKIHPIFNIFYLIANKFLRKLGIISQHPGLEKINR